MTPTERYKQLLAQLKAEGVRIVPKSTKWYWKVLSTLLFVISFGGIDFMRAGTTIGNVIGLPSEWHRYPPSLKYELLLHEAVHIRQYKKYGFGNAWIGVIPVGFAYLFLPFPIGIAYCRMRIERAGYEESIRATIQTAGIDVALSLRDFYVSQFTSANYLWMWPFKKQMNRWFDEAVTRIAAEEGLFDKKN